MSRQVVTKERVEEVRAELTRERLTLSIDRILSRTGGSKTTVARINREIEDEMAHSLTLGADLPPDLLAAVIEFARKAHSHSLVIADRRHEEERQQFRLGLQAHLAECELLKTKCVEADELLKEARLQSANTAERVAAMQTELEASAQRVSALEAELQGACAENRSLLDDLRRLEEYRRVAILLDRVEAAPRNAQPARSAAMRAGSSAMHHSDGEQLDIESFRAPSGDFS